MKYKNKDGIQLNYKGDDIHRVLVREVISEAIRILNSHNHFDSQSKSWAIDRGINFLETNFDIKEECNEISNS
jgi:23S rRNA maturation mini-RNase III